MPGAVVTAGALSTVMPFALYTKFSESTQYKCIINDYADGGRQVSPLVESVRRSWSLAQRLTTSQVSALKAFFMSHNGRQLPFYIYDITQAGVTWDSTGVLTTGRVSVCFNSGWSDSVQLGRNGVTFSLIEIA